MRVRQMSTTSWQAMSKIEHVSRPNQLISCPSGDNSLGVALTSSALCGLGKGDEKQQN
jgi:hypothetical protein